MPPKISLSAQSQPTIDSPSRYRIALADRHALVREAVRRIIADQGDMEVVDEAEDGAGACACSRLSEPDVVILELAMPGLDGVEITREIKQARPAAKVVGLSGVKTPEFIREFFSVGGDGYVFKDGSAEELVSAIRGVRHGIVCPVPEIRIELGQNGKVERLTPRETRLLRLVAKGHSNKEIASLLDLSTKTVETIKARSMQKAQLGSRVDLVRYGAARGWLLPD